MQRVGTYQLAKVQKVNLVDYNAIREEKNCGGEEGGEEPPHLFLLSLDCRKDYTLEKSQTNATSVTLHPLMQGGRGEEEPLHLSLLSPDWYLDDEILKTRSLGAPPGPDF